VMALQFGGKLGCEYQSLQARRRGTMLSEISRCGLGDFNVIRADRVSTSSH